MSILSKCVLLFALNWLDAQLTIFWVRAGLTTEGNPLMAYLLDHSDLLFLAVKILVGFFAAATFYRWSHKLVARRGVKIALAVYAGVMLAHFATGALALGWNAPQQFLTAVLSLPHALLSMI